jgi:hypothetical protein
MTKEIEFPSAKKRNDFCGHIFPHALTREDFLDGIKRFNDYHQETLNKQTKKDLLTQRANLVMITEFLWGTCEKRRTLQITNKDTGEVIYEY